MSRATVIISGPARRAQAVHWASIAPEGTRVEFKRPKRTTPQNDRMWAMLTDVAEQAEHCGRKYTPEQWKGIFMKSLGKEVQFLPDLDGNFFPSGFRSSDLSKDEMGELMDFLEAWGTQQGVDFKC